VHHAAYVIAIYLFAHVEVLWLSYQLSWHYPPRGREIL